jgi:hypothetical protein
LAHSPRITEIYTKQGSIPGYGSFIAVIPEYNIGITINVAGEAAFLATRYLLDLVVQNIVPKLETLTRAQAEVKYAGEYGDGSGSDSRMVVVVDDGPGLRIAEWTSNNVSMIQTWASMQGRDPATAEVRAYPVGEEDRWQVLLNVEVPFALFEQACEQWIIVASFRYAGLPVDEISFVLKDGSVSGLRVPGLRQDLHRLL